MLTMAIRKPKIGRAMMKCDDVQAVEASASANPKHVSSSGSPGDSSGLAVDTILTACAPLDIW